MAIGLILSTMAHHCHRALLGQFLNQAQRKLLTVIFDDSVLFVEAVTLKKLVPIKTSELGPGDLAGFAIVQ